MNTITAAGRATLETFNPNRRTTVKALIGTAPERPEYETVARTLRALTVKVRELLGAAGRIASRKNEPECH